MFKNIKNVIIDMDDATYPKSLKLHTQFTVRLEDYAKKTLKYNDEQTKELVSMWQEDEEIVAAEFKKRNESFSDLMEYVCRLDVSTIEYNPKLRKQLETFPCRKIIYTNTTHSHIDDVLGGRLKVKDLFEEGDFFTTKETNYVFKHNPKAFEIFLKHYNLDSKKTAMIEDNPFYLKSAKQNGMKTILIDENYRLTKDNRDKYDYVDEVVDNINEALDLFNNQAKKVNIRIENDHRDR